MSEDANSNPFNAKTIIILILAGLVGFAAFLLLAAYAPDLRSGQDGRAHGLSTSAVGFRGVYDLLDETGSEVDYIRQENFFARDGLTIVTMEVNTDQERLDALLDEGQYQPTLIVLPKWNTMPVPTERDRVFDLSPNQGRAVRNAFDAIGRVNVRTTSLATGRRLTAPDFVDADFRSSDHTQTISGDELSGIITTPDGAFVLAHVRGTEIFILADPDLLNNQIFASPRAARSALLMLEYLNGDGGPYRFELVANGYGGSANMLTLAFEPPFLALTLSIIAAAILAGLQAAFRFGPAQREPRAIAFGKRALVDNSAELLRIARREHLSSERYVDLTREAAVAAIGNPRQLRGEALDEWLDGFGDESSEKFRVLAARAERATSRQDILNAAQALNKWRKAVTHEA